MRILLFIYYIKLNSFHVGLLLDIPTASRSKESLSLSAQFRMEESMPVDNAALCMFACNLYSSAHFSLVGRFVGMWASPC